jgi:hypothetical protein
MNMGWNGERNEILAQSAGHAEEEKRERKKFLAQRRKGAKQEKRKDF